MELMKLTSSRLSVCRSMAILAALLWTGCAAEPTPKERLPRPVKVVKAERSIGEDVRRFSGTLRAPERTRLAFQVPGRVIERPVELGSRLRSGRLIAALDPTDFQLRVERAEASLARAEARLREATANFERVRVLYAGDSASRSELDRALAALEEARGSRAVGERDLEIARRDLGHTRLLADGQVEVSQLFAEVGETVSVGQPVAALIGLDDRNGQKAFEVVWSVPERFIKSLLPGLEVEVEFPALDGISSRAMVQEVGAAPPDGGATFPIVARIENPEARLRAGMAVEVTLRLGGSSAETVLLPSHAIAGDPEGAFIFVVDGDSADQEQQTVRRREVTVGRLLPRGLEILSGLNAGETVVSAGVQFLLDGQQVRVLRSDLLSELPSTSVSGEGQS